ncbi:hypothetical protein [Amorphus sp. MBR-141]
MSTNTNHPAADYAFAEIAVEQLTVYRYVVALTDDVCDPEAVPLARFKAGETPDLGPADGEAHDLSTFYIDEHLLHPGQA